jgi:hypothetical protein
MAFPVKAFSEFFEGIYLDGQCYELASALWRGLGWDLIGLIQKIGNETVVRHAAVRHPDGGFLDGRGHVSEEEFLEPFGPGVIVDFPLQDNLRKMTRPIDESAICKAGMMAMTVWPDLPWKKDTFIRYVEAFVADLEALCARHGFWLIGGAASQSTWPKIVIGEGDELGYETVGVSKGVYIINRVLKGEV